MVANDQTPTAADDGATMMRWATDLFPICRSLTGEGVRETLRYLRNLLPDLQVHSIPSGTEAFDWTVPNEWNVTDAFVADEDGNRIIDFQQNNLHLVGYSEPIDQRMTFRELEPQLYSLPDQPDAIPYITSYYKRRWGFCLTHNQRMKLAEQPDRQFHVRIDSTLEPGVLNYADLVVPGDSDEEVLFTTYVCHPSMANNELSGVCLLTALARQILTRENRRLTYRFYFGPETIGAITYLCEHLDHFKAKAIAGYVISCIGDNRTYSFQSSREANTLADRAAQHVLNHLVGEYRRYTFLDRGSDERQYCSPGVDLPVCVLSRSKYMEYPEYHTSHDNLDFISADGLQGSLDLCSAIVDALEANHTFQNTCLCEPQLGKRGLYPSLSTKDIRQQVRKTVDLLAYADGSRDLIGIADKIEQYVGDLIPISTQLFDAGVLRKVS